MSVTYRPGAVLLLGGILGLIGISTAFADTTSALLPVSDGAYAQWAPKSGTSHYAMVDESSCNGTTDYVYTNTVGQRDSYSVNISAIPDGATITSVQITPCASRDKTGGGSATMNVFYRFNGSDSAVAGGYALTGTTPSVLSATTYSGLSHVKTNTTGLEIGAVYSAGTKGARLGRIAVVVTYSPAAPTVTTNAATSIATSSATLQGLANPNGTSATGWFRYSATNPGSCSDTFGTRAPVSGGSVLGSGTTSVAFGQGLSGLAPNTTYYYCALANNAGGTTTGSVASFATGAIAPSVTTSVATSVTTSSATLQGSGNPNGAATTGWFRYSTTNPGSCSDTFGTRAPASGGATLGSGVSSVNYSQNITGLTSGVTYYYCAIASNSAGTSTGSILNFTTTATAPAAPSNLIATHASGTQVDLSWIDGSSNESGFKIERSSTGMFGTYTEIGSTTANATTYMDVSGAADQTYHYRVRAYNGVGNSGYSNVDYAITATVVPSAPFDLSATASSSGAVLVWSQTSLNEEGFSIERSTDGISFAEIASYGPNATFYYDNPLTTGTYYYQIRAWNEIGSSYSNVASTTMP